MTRTLRHMSLTLALALAPLALAPQAPAQSQARTPALPRSASPAEVAQLMAKPPAGLEIVDIRPQAEFADYALPASLNLDAAAVLADDSFASGSGPLLLVDKNGTQAFAVAGVLAQKTSRPVLVLTGGLAAWWAAQEKGMAVKEVPLADQPSPAAAPAAAPAGPATPGTPQPATPQPSDPATPPAPASPAPQPPAAKSAGC
ncbi:rhodanese-like domain-containing protein [Fundidesulfovibrio putealis]|uniref:rhodanese-like domain-containing protein n=1 Tax=Fundidesulfovibrio putealis TaxID=270496 RepID=UPI0004234B6B|nr:rhodanese-like domain-containing protein [Fundidesulfovibrio putealis]